MKKFAQNSVEFCILFVLAIIFFSVERARGGGELQFSILSTYTTVQNQSDVSPLMSPFASWRTEHEKTVIRSTNLLTETFFNHIYFATVWHPGPDHEIRVSDFTQAHWMDPYNFLMRQSYEVQVFGSLSPPPGKSIVASTNFSQPSEEMFQFPLEVSRAIDYGTRSRTIRESTGTILFVNTDSVLPHTVRMVFYHDGLSNGEITKKIEASSSLVYSPTLADINKALGFNVANGRAVLFFVQQID